MKINLLKYILMLISIHYGYCQPNKALTVGDHVPPFVIKNIINYPSGEIDISSPGSDLIILDFFAIFCSPCVKELERIDSLQKQISGFMLLPATGEKMEKVRGFLKRKKWDIAIAAERDNYLKKLFPYTIISHLVWIKNGEVVAITDSKRVTEKNIKAILRNEQINLPLKADDLDYDITAPLANNGDDILFQSVFTGYREEIPGGISKVKNGISYRNATPLSLFKYIFGDASQDNYQFQFDNRIILEINDSLKRIISFNEKIINNRFCYNIFYQHLVTQDKLLNAAKLNLNQFFREYLGIEGYIEKRRVKYLALRRTTSKDLMATVKVGQKKGDDGSLVLQNKPFKLLLTDLYSISRKSSLPVVDVTGYTGKIDIRLSGNLVDINNLKRQLEKYGLTLREEIGEIDMLVITTAKGECYSQ